PPGFPARGTSKSAVSRRFVAATREQLALMMGRSLAGLALRAVMIDGIHVGEHVVLIALGIDEQGDSTFSACTRARRRMLQYARVCSPISLHAVFGPIARCSSWSRAAGHSPRPSASRSAHEP